MPIRISTKKVVEVGVSILIGGIGIVSFQACQSEKSHTARIAERRDVRTPLIQGRSATKADFDSGAAIFYIPGGRSAPYPLRHALPVRAEVVKSGVGDWSIGHQVLVVQAELTDGQHVTLGVIDGSEHAVCSLDDVKLLE